MGVRLYFISHAVTPPTGLESITEGTNTGWRLVGSAPGNYGDIGEHAVDFSESSIISATFGATGDYSSAFGFNTTAANDYSVAFGKNNTGETGTVMEVGWGFSYLLPENILELYEDGTLVLPSATNAEIGAKGDQAVVTRGYFNANVPSPTYEKVKLSGAGPYDNGDTIDWSTSYDLSDFDFIYVEARVMYRDELTAGVTRIMATDQAIAEAGLHIEYIAKPGSTVRYCRVTIYNLTTTGCTVDVLDAGGGGWLGSAKVLAIYGINF